MTNPETTQIPNGGPATPVIYTRPRMVQRGDKIGQVPELVAEWGESIRARMVRENVAAMLTRGGMTTTDIVPLAVRLADQAIRALGLVPSEPTELMDGPRNRLLNGTEPAENEDGPGSA